MYCHRVEFVGNDGNSMPTHYNITVQFGPKGNNAAKNSYDSIEVWK